MWQLFNFHERHQTESAHVWEKHEWNTWKFRICRLTIWSVEVFLNDTTWQNGVNFLSGIIRLHVYNCIFNKRNKHNWISEFTFRKLYNTWLEVFIDDFGTYIHNHSWHRYIVCDYGIEASDNLPLAKLLVSVVVKFWAPTIRNDPTEKLWTFSSEGEIVETRTNINTEYPLIQILISSKTYRFI